MRLSNINVNIEDTTFVHVALKNESNASYIRISEFKGYVILLTFYLFFFFRENTASKCDKNLMHFEPANLHMACSS